MKLSEVCFYVLTLVVIFCAGCASDLVQQDKNDSNNQKVISGVQK